MTLDGYGLVRESTMEEIAAAIRERTAAGGGSGGGTSVWDGSRAAYEAMSSHDANTWYFIRKETS